MIEIPDLRSAKLTEISDFMFMPDCPIDASATIVLGQTLWKRPLLRSIDVYEAGLAGKLVFTGGFNPRVGDSEASCMAKAWIKLGFDSGCLLVDREASNTKENMLNARALMERDILTGRNVSINIVAISYHMRRAVETCKLVFSDYSLDIGTVSYPSIYCDEVNWHRNSKGKSLVLNELEKIERYLTIQN